MPDRPELVAEILQTVEPQKVYTLEEAERILNTIGIDIKHTTLAFYFDNDYGCYVIRGANIHNLVRSYQR